MLRRMVQQLTPLDSKDKIVIGLVDVNHSETMNFATAGILGDQGIDDLVPSGIGKAFL